MGSRLNAFSAGHQAAEAQAHEDFVEAAVQVVQQAAFQTEVGLFAGEQVLHHRVKAGAAAGELDHAGGDVAEEEAAVEDAFREAGTEFQVGGEIAAKLAAVAAGGELARFV